MALAPALPTFTAVLETPLLLAPQFCSLSLVDRVELTRVALRKGTRSVRRRHIRAILPKAELRILSLAAAEPQTLLEQSEGEGRYCVPTAHLWSGSPTVEGRKRKLMT